VADVILRYVSVRSFALKAARNRPMTDEATLSIRRGVPEPRWGYGKLAQLFKIIYYFILPAWKYFRAFYVAAVADPFNSIQNVRKGVAGPGRGGEGREGECVYALFLGP